MSTSPDLSFGETIAKAYAVKGDAIEIGRGVLDYTRLRAPESRTGPADDVDEAAKASPLIVRGVFDLLEKSL